MLELRKSSPIFLWTVIVVTVTEILVTVLIAFLPDRISHGLSPLFAIIGLPLMLPAMPMAMVFNHLPQDVSGQVGLGLAAGMIAFSAIVWGWIIEWIFRRRVTAKTRRRHWFNH
jgi:hypothetical protein